MDSVGDDRQEPEPFEDEQRRPSKRRCISVQPHREVGFMRSLRGDRSSGFIGSASGIYFIKSVYNALQQPEPERTNVATPASDVVPGEDDQLPSVLPQVSERLWGNGENVVGPASSICFEDLIEISGSYFANWHPFYPFLHAPTVLSYFSHISCDITSHADSSRHLESVIVRSIMSISLADQRQAGHVSKLPYPADMVFFSYDAAVDSLQHILSSPTSILCLQAAISVQLFLVCMLRLNAASRLGGLINRMALQLGLHRCPARYQSFSDDEKLMRQRIFWSLYALDRFICQSMGLPLGINDDDVDVCFPSEERHLEVEKELKQDDKLKILSFIARESRLRGEIIELRNKSLHYVQRDPDQGTAITAKLAQWWNDIEDTNDEENEQRLSNYPSVVLTLLKHESIISLHRPILAASRRGVEYDAALQLCVGSARSIITLLHDAIKTRDDTLRAYEPMALLWPSCTWAVWISTFILFYATKSSHLSHETVMRLTDRSIQVLQHLARRGSAWPEASAAAIRDLRNRMTRTPTNGRNNLAGHSDQQARASPTPIDQPALSSTGIPNANDDASFGVSSVSQPQNQAPIEVSSAWGDVPAHLPQGSTMSNIRPHDSAYNSGNVLFDSFLFDNTALGQDGNPGALDPFSRFDIPFWFEEDQYWNIFQNLD